MFIMPQSVTCDCIHTYSVSELRSIQVPSSSRISLSMVVVVAFELVGQDAQLKRYYILIGRHIYMATENATKMKSHTGT